MQKTLVLSLIWEDPTLQAATKSMCHNYWTGALEPRSHKWAYMLYQLKPVCPRTCATQQEKSPQEAQAPQLDSSLHHLQAQSKACAATKAQHSQKQITN